MTLASSIIEPKYQIPETDKTFTNEYLLKLCIPIIVESFLTFLVGMVDSMMVSYAGEATVSGVSLINQLNNVFIMIFRAIATGGGVVVSQYIGSKEKEKGNLAAAQLMMIGTMISLAMMVLILYFGKDIYKGLYVKLEPEVFDAGCIYLMITAFSFPVMFLYQGCARVLQAVNRTKEIMYVSLGMNILNVIGNAIGIFVLKAGVRGVAYPSLISRAVAAFVLLGILMDKDNAVYVELSKIFYWNKTMIKRIFSIAIPNTVEDGLFQLAKVVLSMIVAYFGTIQITAYGVAGNFWQVASIFACSMGPALLTVSGQCMGAGKPESAEYYLRKLLRMTYFGQIIWCTSFTMLTPVILKFYSLSPETIKLTIAVVVVHNVGNIFFAPLSFAFAAGLRGAGDAKYCMYTAIFTSVIIRVALSFLFGVYLGWGAVGITAAMVCDWAVKGTLTWTRFVSGKWKTKKVI